MVETFRAAEPGAVKPTLQGQSPCSTDAAQIETPRSNRWFRDNSFLPQQRNDAYTLARTLAGYLGLPILDHHGATRKIEDDGPYVWHPSMPDPNDPHRRRRLRRRRHRD